MICVDNNKKKRIVNFDYFFRNLLNSFLYIAKERHVFETYSKDIF